MPIRKSHILGGVEELGIAVRYEQVRLAFFNALDAGSGVYADRIADIEDRRNFYWMRIQELQQ